MVIGNGMVATKFESFNTNDEYVIFASGVSNSKTSDPSAYKRESGLLQKTIRENSNKTLVYFSTCSIYDPGEASSAYVLHKLGVEEFIRSNSPQYYIFRVSNLVGKSTNHNTVLNFFYYHIINKINFDLWQNAERNLMDIDDAFRIIDYLLRKKLYQNQVTNIANPVNYKVISIIEALENLLGLKANYIPIPKGNPINIDTKPISPILKELNVNFGSAYLSNMIKKYYLHQ